MRAHGLSIIWDTHRRKYRLPVTIAVLPDHHIPPAQFLEIVGERAQRPQRRVRVSTRLVFDPLAFHLPPAQQVFEVDGEFREKLNSVGIPDPRQARVGKIGRLSRDDREDVHQKNSSLTEDSR